MAQLREDLWKDKAKLIKEKDSVHNKLEDLEQRLKQVSACTSIHYVEKFLDHSTG